MERFIRFCSLNILFGLLIFSTTSCDTHHFRNQLPEGTDKSMNGNNVNANSNQRESCSASISSPTLETLQKSADEMFACYEAVQTAMNPLEEINSYLQRMNELAVQGSNVITSPEDYIALSEEFNSLIVAIQTSIENAKYNEQPLLSGEPQVFSYALLDSSVTCMNTADVSVTDINEAIAELSLSDLASSQNSATVLAQNIIKLSHIRSVAGLIANRVSQDLNQVSNLQTVVGMPPAPSICDLVFLVASSGIKGIEQTLDSTRQALANFEQLNADTSEVGYQANSAKILSEMYSAIDHALTLNSVNGQELFKGQNEYTGSCFDGKLYNLQISALGLENLSLSNQANIIATVQKLDKAIALIEAKKIGLGVSDVNTDMAAATTELTRLQIYQQIYQAEHLDDTCVKFDISVVTMELSTKKVARQNKELTALNKIYSPLPNDLNTSIQAGNMCISVLQTAEGGLNEIVNITQRIRELGIQAANGTNSSQDREAIQNEVTSLVNEIIIIKNNTIFNGRVLLNGDAYILKYFSDKTVLNCFESAEFDINSVISALQSLSMLEQQSAEASIPIIDEALLNLNAERSNGGAIQNKTGYEINLYQRLQENTSAARSSGTAYTNQYIVTIAGGGLTSIQEALQRMGELATQAANENTPELNRSYMQLELVELLGFVDLANSLTAINSNTLISGDSVFKEACFNGTSFDARKATLGITNIEVSTMEGAINAASLIQAASDSINSQLQKISELVQ